MQRTLRLIWILLAGVTAGATLASCGDDATPVATTPLAVHVVAGPICPVESNPPDPNCEARVVADATIIVRDASGAEIASGVTDADGNVDLEVPAGTVTLEGLPVEGLMGVPKPLEVQVPVVDAAPVVLTYDTGIR